MDIIYGRRSFLELVSGRSQVVKVVYLSEQAATDPEVAKGVEILTCKGVKIVHTNLDIIREKSRGGNHQGILCEIAGKEPMQPDAWFENIKHDDLVVGLDGITDPQNLGSIMRVCDSAGVKGLFWEESHSCPITPTVRRVSSGTSEYIDSCIFPNMKDGIDALKSANFTVVGTALTPTAIDLYSFEFTKPVVILMGAEGRGLRKSIQQRCDYLVKIPMFGKVQSLNVAQATAVTLFEIRRKGLKGLI